MNPVPETVYADGGPWDRFLEEAEKVISLGDGLIGFTVYEEIGITIVNENAIVKIVINEG